MKKWFNRIATALVAITVLATAGVYAVSEMRLSKTYDTALVDFDATKFHFAPEVAEQRAKSLMCMSCHGEAGHLIFEEKNVGRLVAPNLSKKIPEYSDSELERLIRKGIKRDGTGVIAMPSATYAKLADEDVAAIITFMRSRVPRDDQEKRKIEFGPLGRLALALGKIPYEADHVTQFNYPKMRPDDVAPYLVAATCSHCHDLDKARDNGFGMKAPPLKMMVQSYTFEEFSDFFKTGKAKGGREVGLMSELARVDFAHFTDTEKRVIYDYLVKE
jgi:cytochrome c553